MKILPASGDDWFALLLLPFKVFVPAGWLMLEIQRSVGNNRAVNGELLFYVLGGYYASFVVLTVGGMIQYRWGLRKAYLSTCGFVIALFVFGALVLPYLAGA